MIAIVDYGMGNLGSVMNACRYLGLEAELVTEPEKLERADAVILPGVGAFGDCMAHLEARQLAPAIRDWLESNRPYLGICLGLQVLCAGSEESPGVRGLGLLETVVSRFKSLPGMKVPHMGWNQLRVREVDCPLLAGIADGEYFYFVHSYYVPAEFDGVAATTDYGRPFCSVYHRGNIYAIQFHPERSHRAGLRVLRNFARIVKECQAR